MKFLWMTVASHNAQMADKDKKIAELEAQLSDDGKSANGDAAIAKLTALFGDAAEEEGFDLEAAVKKMLDYSAGLETDLATAQSTLAEKETALTAATERLDAVAKVLGHDSAEGVDLKAEVEGIEPAARTNPKRTTDPKPKADETDYMCKYDDELAELKKKLKIG